MKDMKDVMEKRRAGEELDAEMKKKLGCSTQCVMEKQGVWKDGGLDTAALEEKMSEFKMLDKIPNVKEIIQECAAKKGTDDCDTAFEIMHCMKSKFPRPHPRGTTPASA